MMFKSIKRIVACGCSHSYGFISRQSVFYKKGSCNKDYNTIFAEEIDAELVHLGKPGATNYMIAKQIEYSLKYNPELVIFNITGPLRVSIILDKIHRLTDIPTLEQFDYDEYTNQHTRLFEPRIKTVPRTTLNMAKITNPEHQIIVDYWNRYADQYLLLDQDLMMIDSALSKLSSNNIPYICCNFSDMNISNNVKNILPIPRLRDILKEFSIEDDPFHFSQQGHAHIANEIKKYFIDHSL